MKQLTAGGFRDTTRLASGSPAMHRDILLTNREAVLRWIDAMSASLGELRRELASTDQQASERLEAFFTEARDARADLGDPTHAGRGTAAGYGFGAFDGERQRSRGPDVPGGFAKKLRTPPGGAARAAGPQTVTSLGWARAALARRTRGAGDS